MSANLIAPDAEKAAHSLGTSTWAIRIPQPPPADDCGSGLSGWAFDLMQFVRPLEELLEKATGDPASLYTATMAWEVHAGTMQTASSDLKAVGQSVASTMQGLFAEALEQVIGILAEAAHSLANWSKVVSQMFQVCVRVVEIMRNLVCAGFQIIASIGSGLADLFFGSWPWEISEKQRVLSEFSQNCAQIITEVTGNINLVLQALRELARLATDLYRAVIPFHQEIENVLGKLIEVFPPGKIPGLGGIFSGLDKDSLGAKYEPGPNPFKGSDHEFEGTYDLGYSHKYPLGPTDMTTEELNAHFRANFGHIFAPSRVGDNSQLNAELTHVGQTIDTSLMGLELPGITAGEIQVTQMLDDGFVIAAQPGHPEYPGEVAFRISNVNGQAVFEVAAAYDNTALDNLEFSGNTNPAFAGLIASGTVWRDVEGRLRDSINYGS